MANSLATAGQRRDHDMMWPSHLLGIDDDCIHFLDELHSRIRKFKDAEINCYSVYRQYIAQQNAKILHDISSLLHQIDEPNECSDMLRAINYPIPDYMRLHAVTGVVWNENAKTRSLQFIAADEQKTIEKLCAIGLTQHQSYEIKSNAAGTSLNADRLEFAHLSWLGFIFMKIVN